MIGRFGRTLAAFLAVLPCSGAASAGLTSEEYRAIGVTVPANAAFPLSAKVVDETGQTRALATFITRPTVLVFASYTCGTLCGPAIAFVADALEQSGLSTDQFGLIVVGLDPHDRPAEVGRTWRASLEGAVINNAAFLSADATTIAALTAALGYRYRYDQQAAQYIHPAAAFVLGADGRVSRVLTELGLTAQDLRLALVESGQGRVGSFGDQVRLICSAFDPKHGIYTLAISRVLAGAGGITILLIAGGIGLLLRADRRALHR